MANLTIPVEERNLTPDEVEKLDRRRHWGLTCQVLGGQFAFFAILITLWSGQDATYSPGWVHPMLYLDFLCAVLALGFFGYGTHLKRGSLDFVD
jgi:hydrogenase/urease accessory protein HupE